MPYCRCSEYTPSLSYLPEQNIVFLLRMQRLNHVPKLDPTLGSPTFYCVCRQKMLADELGLIYHLLRRLGRVGAIDLALRLTTCVTIFAIACVVDIGDTEIYDSLALPR